jgi:hypothetical protein
MLRLLMEAPYRWSISHARCQVTPYLCGLDNRLNQNDKLMTIRECDFEQVYSQAPMNTGFNIEDTHPIGGNFWIRIGVGMCVYLVWSA